MFVRYFVEIPLPHAEVEASLLDSPSEWMPGVAREAEARGRVLLTEVGFGDGGLRVEKGVQIELRLPVRLESKTILPMSWTPTGLESLFPSLEADLEVAALGPHRTQLSLSARYEPPLGGLGRAMDRALLHRVAEATIKDFLDRAGKRIEDSCARSISPR